MHILTHLQREIKVEDTEVEVDPLDAFMQSMYLYEDIEHSIRYY